MKLHEIQAKLFPLLNHAGEPETVEGAQLAINLIDVVADLMNIADTDNRLKTYLNSFMFENELEAYGDKPSEFGVRFKGVKE